MNEDHPTVDPPSAPVPAGADAGTQADAPATRGPSVNGGREPDSPEDLVLAILSDGPLAVAAIAHRVDAAWPDFLAARAGLVHPLLLRLTAQGRVVPTAVHGGTGPRVGYALPPSNGRAGEDAWGALEALPSAPARAFDRVASRVAGGLDHAPPLAARMRRETAEHLTDSFTARRREGASEDDALKSTLKDFGDPWRVRTDLRRVAAGRRAYLFPRSLIESLRGSLSHDAWILLVIVTVIVFVRLQVLSAYHIPTRSMEPTLHGDRKSGDRILVNRLSGTPERGEITVFGGWGTERKNYVKRCMGLPGDRLRVREGDLYLDGELLRKRGDLYEQLLFPWWSLTGEWRRARLSNEDDEETAIDDFRAELSDLFAPASGKWVLHTDGTFEGAPPPIGEAVLRLTDPVDDRRYDESSGDSDGGYPEVPDGRFTVTLHPLEASTRTTVRMTRGSIRVDLVADAADGSLRLLVDERVVFEQAGLVRAGEDLDVRLALVDRVARLDAGETHAEHELPQAEFPRRDAPSGTFEVRVADGRSRARVTRIERDVHYTSDYDDDEWILGPDEFFMMGDNSSNSEDSRAKGPVHRKRLIGRPIMIVWPPGRIRLLSSPENE